MAITKPPVLPPWADSGDKVQPTNAEIESGWPNGAVPPSRQRFNWILNFCANAVRYFSRRGVADYDEDETYAVEDIVRGDDGLVYRSLQESNIGHTPSASPLWWGPIKTRTPDAADNSNHIATTSWVRSSMSVIATAAGFSVSKNANGYIKLPAWLGGLILQWGAVVGSTSADVAFAFPIPFPTGVFRALATVAQGAGALPQFASIGNMTQSEIYVSCWTISGIRSNQTMFIFAIGH